MKPLIIAGRTVKNGTHWNIVWQFLKKLNINLPYDSASLLLEIYLRNIIPKINIKYLREI